MPDQDLAKFLKKFLAKQGYDCFLDPQLQVGTEWVKEIEKQIKGSDFFIPLLSKDSILSDIVRQEVKLAGDLRQKRGERFKILPLRVNFTGKLPYDLGAYLDGFPYALWKPGEDFNVISSQVLNALETTVELPLKDQTRDLFKLGDYSWELQNLFDTLEEKGAPLPAMDPRLIPQVEPDTGIVKPGSSFYVTREADRKLMKSIQNKGATVIVKGARQMGKSSLLTQARSEARKYGLECCYLDFQFLEPAYLTGLDALFRCLANKIGQAFNTTIKPADCWDEGQSPNDNFTGFIKDALLANAQSPVLLLLDEVDRLFNQPYREDFFSTLRTWHNLRAEEEEWEYLNLVLAHSAEPYPWVRDIYRSPFNVGTLIQLEDFGPQQVRELNLKYGQPLADEEDILELIQLTGGQPYLVRLALYIMAKEHYNLLQLNRLATEDFGPFGDHLRQILWRLQGLEGLSDILRQVLRKGQCDYEPHFLRLRSAGYIKGETRESVKVRCQLYEDYFWKHL